MRGLRGWGLAVLCLWLAGGCQQAVSPRAVVGSTGPDFLLVTISCLALLADRRRGAVLGFAGGLLHGALVGAGAATYAVTRTLAGYLAGWTAEAEMEGSPAVAFLVAGAATLFTGLVVSLGAARGPLAPFLGGTLLAALVNGALAMPLYYVLRKLLNPPEK